MNISKPHIYLVLCVAALAPGCATQSQKSAAALDQFRYGRPDSAIQQFVEGHRGRSRQLYMLESARLKMLEGRFADSKEDFQKAIEAVAVIEEGAVIRLRDVGTSTLASTITDDTIRPYFLPGYELVMAFHEQALNYLFMSDPEGAAVELRRAVYAQDLIAKQNEKQLEEAREKLKDENYADGYAQANASYVAMGPALARVKNSYQDAYTWYVAGLVYEAINDKPNAYISYKKAWEIMPDNLYVQRDVIRLASTENRQEYDDFAAKYPAAADSVSKGGSECIFILEEGLISRRESVKVPLIISGTITTVMFPVYEDPPYQPLKFHARVDDAEAGNFDVICYMQSLAYQDLMEKLPGIIVRNVTRAVSRGVAYNQTQHTDDETVTFIGFVANLMQAIADQADTRAWYSLPMAVQILRVPVSPGDHRVQIVNSASGRAVEARIHLDRNEKKLIWLADIGGRASACAASLSGKKNGGEPAFAKLKSIIDDGGGFVGPMGMATGPVSAVWMNVEPAPTPTPTPPASGPPDPLGLNRPAGLLYTAVE